MNDKQLKRANEITENIKNLEHIYRNVGYKTALFQLFVDKKYRLRCFIPNMGIPTISYTLDQETSDRIFGLIATRINELKDELKGL